MNIDDLFEQAKSMVNVAAKKTNEVVEISKLKLDCLKINSEIKGMYEKLGRTAYNMHHDSYKNDHLLKSLCEEIDELLSKLNDLTEKIADKQNVVICPVCRAKNLQDSFYCSKCGAKIKDEFEGFDFRNATSEAEPTPEEPSEKPLQDTDL